MFAKGILLVILEQEVHEKLSSVPSENNTYNVQTVEAPVAYNIL